VVLPAFVVDALAETAKGKGREDLLSSTHAGGYLGPPSSTVSWLSGAALDARSKTPRSLESPLMHYVTRRPRWRSARARTRRWWRMLGHASAAMTLDVYADLFDSDLTSVAESVGKLWARQAN
jgi:hypothetical protein